MQKTIYNRLEGVRIPDSFKKVGEKINYKNQ